MNKKIIIGLIASLFTGMTTWLIVTASGAETLAIDSEIPNIIFTTKDGNNELLYNNLINQIPSVIIYFSTECEHCQYELKQINENIKKFNSTNVYLFTAQKDFFSKKELDDWRLLYNSPNVIFGVVNKDVFKNNFGSQITPSIFIFNRKNKLMKKTLGEIKIEKLIEYLNI